MAKHPCVRRQRRYWWQGGLYVIRQTRIHNCEYAVRNPNGSKRWLPCYEGVEFASIAPLRVRRFMPLAQVGSWVD